MSNILEIYCDGGCRGNHKDNNVGGWGSYITLNGKTLELYGGTRDTTNNQMELIACIEALKAIKNTKIKTVVTIDSKYVFKGITQWVIGWIRNGWRTSNKQPVKNKELWVELFAQKSRFRNISFELCKGHVGIDGNEKADELANLGMDLIEEQPYSIPNIKRKKEY